MKKNIFIIILLILFSLSSINTYIQYNKHKNLIDEQETAINACFDDNTILEENNTQLANEIEILKQEKENLKNEIEALKKN